ncbi:hypothetical protein D3H65_21230 [Paraflavitalea soli]|uniref:Uncharacterized protein n=1 Tax=Paraflavitalea soli TaxID=2315862 RepID=A0A3B7MPD3_9BACT|nr:hypothetical protein [Paraflavitalea soli]AXY76362.1 hypothetical protein D3H65_21230 [Paraflavitalea soli]
MNFRNIRISAAIIALVYIAIQSFQWYVFDQFTTPSSAAEELQQGNHPLHLVRSSLMLGAMFGLMYIRYVICSLAAVSYRFWATLAFICYFVFFMLEVLLRSTELFYTQIQLPKLALKTNANELQAIVDKFQTLQSIQSALYFPLILAGTCSYAILFFLFPAGKQKINRLIKFVLGVDLLRSVWRLSSDYFGVQWLQGNFYDQIYLPLVVITFGSISIWLLKVKDERLA